MKCVGAIDWIGLLVLLELFALSIRIIKAIRTIRTSRVTRAIKAIRAVRVTRVITVIRAIVVPYRSFDQVRVLIQKLQKLQFCACSMGGSGENTRDKQ